MLVLIIALVTGSPYHPPQPQAGYWIEYQAHLDKMDEIYTALDGALGQ